MTEDDEEKRQKIREIYRYDEMSNKVLRADKSLIESRSDIHRDAELSQPKSMSGKISLNEMGSAVKKVSLEQTERAAAEKQFERRFNNSSHQKPGQNQLDSRTVLDDISSLNYFPTDGTNTEVYDAIISWCAELLGDDIPHSVIVDATDLIIVTMKQDEGSSLDQKKTSLEEVLDVKVTDTSFNTLLQLVRKISDYNSVTSGVSSIDQTEMMTNVVQGDSEEEEEDIDEENALIEAANEEADDEEDEFSNREQVANDDEFVRNDLLISTETLELKSTFEEPAQLLLTDIDEFFLQRKLRANMKNVDETKIQQMAIDIYSSLSDAGSLAELKATLIDIIGADRKSLLNLIMHNRETIYWGLRLKRTPDANIDNVLLEMESKDLSHLIHAFKLNSESNKRSHDNDIKEEKEVEASVPVKKQKSNVRELKVVDLDDFKASQTNKFLNDVKISLPENSFKRVKEGYEEIHIPPPGKVNDKFPLVAIKDLPEWAQSAFPSAETSTLNRVQSEVYPSAFLRDINLLICAPTGAGKTNVAMLSVLRVMHHHYNEEKNTFDLKKFKIVYIAPLKALVQEQVREFQRRLHHFGVKVAELTGDSNLSKQQIDETQILVATPEKWDVITRKSTDTSFHKLVRLIIVDEVHLLHDERGPVIESIVMRTLREKKMEISTRLVALSATLPNYHDVAEFLQVPADGLFFFNSAFRPCPLAQQYCGITEKNTLKRKNAMNQACYDKLLEATKEGHQVIVFVHSRKDTVRTGKWLSQKLLEEDKQDVFMPSDKGSIEILKTESKNAADKHLSELIPAGFGIHHAGLSKADRSLSEDLFADGLLKVLVSTATLAWGVNLPAHTVIIKGTEIYSPEKGGWVMLPPQDILQMLGRAGRPRYDVNGEGIIITNQSDVRYYLAVLNQQLPIESQLMSKLVDNVNAEVVLGNITSLNEAIEWLQYSYYSVRISKSPETYNVTQEEASPIDIQINELKRNILHSALTLLQQHNLLVYDRNNGKVEATDLGRISSHFYISYSSIAIYNRELTASSSLIDVLRTFSMSEEFKNITVRQEERLELEKLLERAPIPIKENHMDSLAKSNVLLQAYISKLKLEGFALNADMIYISQSGGRLFRALYEMCLRKRWARLTRLLLTMCKCVDNRMWPTNSPLRSFRRCSLEIIKRAEASGIPWSDFLSLKSSQEVGEALRSPKDGKLVFDALKKFPKIGMSCSIQPITSSLIRFELECSPSWSWDYEMNNLSEGFLVLVEDTDGETIMYQDFLRIGMKHINKTVYIEFVVFLRQRTLPPNFFVSLISEKWVNCEYKIPLVFESIQLPKQFPAPMLPSGEQRQVDELQVPEFISCFHFRMFNRIQSEVFDILYKEDLNSLVCAPKGSGKTIIAELALLNNWREGKGRAVYICPCENKILELTKDWRKRFSGVAGGKTINSLSNNVSQNVKLLAQSHVTLCTPEQFDFISRRWPQRKNVQRIELIIFDDAHMVGDAAKGGLYETVITRMLFISTQLESSLRIIGLATSLASPKDFAEWIGVKKGAIFNFAATERPSPLKVEIEVSEFTENPATNRKALLEIVDDISYSDQTSTVFVADRHQCISVASALVKVAMDKGINLLRTEGSSLASYLKKVQDTSVKTFLTNGIGILYENMPATDRATIYKLRGHNVLSILVASKDTCTDIPTSHSVVIATTKCYDGTEERNLDYPVSTILEMVGCSSDTDFRKSTTVKLITTTQRNEYYKKFLSEGLPLESFLPYHIMEVLANEIANQVLETKQDCIDLLTYTYLYRRIHANPSYYGMKAVSADEISTYLTDLVEETIDLMRESEMISLNEKPLGGSDKSDEVLHAQNACLLVGYHPVSATTISVLNKATASSMRLNNLLELLSSSQEFQNLRIRSHDVSTLKKLNAVLPLKFSTGFDECSVKCKVFLLLQAHFSGLHLPYDLKLDLNCILSHAPALGGLLVDILASNGYLNATTAMDLCQMIVQGVWDTDSPLKQIPSFDDNILQKCKEFGVESVYDVMGLEDEEREQIITLPENELNKVAEFVNSYPNIELNYDFDTSIPLHISESRAVNVIVTRDETPESTEVVSKALTHQRIEGWWIFLGDKQTKQLYAIKKVVLAKMEQQFELEIEFKEAGDRELTLWCVCDSYLDADKEVSFPVSVIP